MGFQFLTCGRFQVILIWSEPAWFCFTCIWKIKITPKKMKGYLRSRVWLAGFEHIDSAMHGLTMQADMPAMSRHSAFILFLFPMAPFFKVVHQSCLFCSKWSFVLRTIYQGFKSINRHRRVGIMWSDDYQSVAISSIYWWGLINHVKNSADINGRSCESKCIEIQWMIHHSENTQISIETSQKITSPSEILFNMFLQLCFTSSTFLSVFT